MSRRTLRLLYYFLLLVQVTVHGMLDEDWDAQLQILNKPPLKTFQDKAGDTIDCIDIHKQPAFDNPLLKNHKIQLRRDSPPKISKPRMASTSDAKYTRDIVCPKGSVPIRRTGKEDLIRAKSFSRSFATSIHPSTGYTPGKHLAIVRSRPNRRIVYKGIKASLAICNPVVSGNLSSSSQMWIQNGARNVVNSLQAGWIVSPKLFRDNLTRSFAYWKVGPSKGCFNLLCAGFIQTGPHFVLGGPIDKSTYGYGEKPGLEIRLPGPDFAVEFSIAQDMETGNWWFDLPSHNINVGYWPKELVPLLQGGGTQVTWGGQAMGQSNGPSPQMGSGDYPAKTWISDRASFFKQMFILDTTNYWVEPAGPYYQTETFVDDPKCYGLRRYGYNGGAMDYSFSFGGPGGICGV